MRAASWWATRAVVVASAVVVAVTVPAAIAPSDAAAQGSQAIGLQLVPDPTDQYAQRVVAPAVQLGTGQPISVELDTGSMGLFVDSQYTKGLPLVIGQCTTGCTVSYSGGVILTYNVVSAQVTIGTAAGSVSTSGPIDIGSITSATCLSTDPACRCPSTARCEAALFGPGAGIMGIALGQSEPATSPLVQSPLVQLQPSSFLFNGYTMALGPTPELLPPSSSSNTISVPLIPNGGPAYPDGFPSYLKGLNLCWTVGSVGPVCAASANQNLTVIDSGNPGPRISSSVGGFPSTFNNLPVSISTPTSQGLWSFTSEPSPPGAAADDLEYLNTLGRGTGFNTGIGFLLQNQVGYNLQTGQALITPSPGCQDTVGIYNQGFNAGFNSAFNSGFNSGFNAGFRAGFRSGFTAGFGSPARRATLSLSSLAPSHAHAIAAQALPPGCDPPFNQGFNTGFNSGFNPRFQRGFVPGFTSGFNSGFNGGHNARHRRHHK
jgi:hypothetical protein